MEVKIKKLVPEAVIPSYSKEGDCGLDLTAINMEITNLPEYGFIEYRTGLSIEIPSGYVGLIFPRSSISTTGLILANCVGVIDSGYRGEIKCRFKHITRTNKYSIGDRIAQLVIMPYPNIELKEVSELSSTERSDGSFGSTGA